MEAKPRYLSRGERKVPLAHFYLESEQKGQETLRRRAVHHSSGHASIPGQCSPPDTWSPPGLSSPPSHTSTPPHTSTPRLPKGDWRHNFSTKSESGNSSTRDWSMAGDSGYGGLDCSRDRYSSASKSNSFPKKPTGLASFPWRKLQDLQRKIAGRPSFIETEKNSRWMKVQPQQVLFCIVLCIVIASICFSVLITYKHLNSSTRIGRSNGKYRSIQYGASSQTTQEVKKTKDVTTESVLDVLDSLNDFEKIFYDDPSSLDLEDKSGKIDLENLRVEMEAEENLVSSGLAENKAQAEVELAPNLEELTIMKLEEEFQKSKEELINKIKSFGQQAGPVKVDYSKEGSKSEIKEMNVISEMDVKTKKLEPKQPKQKPKRSKKKNPLVKSYSPKVSKRKSLKKEM